MGLFAPETLNIPPSRGFHRAFEEKLSLIRTQKFRRNETAIGSFASHYPINILRQWHSALYARESERELARLISVDEIGSRTMILKLRLRELSRIPYL